MDSLTDVLGKLDEKDQVLLEKQAEEMKLAGEEDAAGRIMARGFADELTKLADGFAPGANAATAGLPQPGKPKPAPAPKPANTGGNVGLTPPKGGMQKAPAVPTPLNTGAKQPGVKGPAPGMAPPK